MLKKITIIKSVPFKYGVIELRSDNIITHYPNKGVEEYTVANLELMLTILSDLTKDSGPLPYFSENKNIKRMSGDTKAYIMQHMSKFASEFAMTENSAINRFLTHSFLTFWRPPFPVKMFKTEEQAIKWLKEFKK